MTAAKAKIFLVDDHPLVREWLGNLIEKNSDLTVCGDAEDAPAALEAIARAWFPDGRQAVAIDLAAHSMPVQLIWGRDDHIIPAARATALAGPLPVHILDAAGHLPHMEKAGEVNRLIARFIAAS